MATVGPEERGHLLRQGLSIPARVRHLDEIVYQCNDLIKQDDEGYFRLLSRRVDLFERVIRSKNLLFFL